MYAHCENSEKHKENEIMHNSIIQKWLLLAVCGSSFQLSRILKKKKIPVYLAYVVLMTKNKASQPNILLTKLNPLMKERD